MIHAALFGIHNASPWPSYLCLFVSALTLYHNHLLFYPSVLLKGLALQELFFDGAPDFVEAQYRSTRDARCSNPFRYVLSINNTFFLNGSLMHAQRLCFTLQFCNTHIFVWLDVLQSWIPISDRCDLCSSLDLFYVCSHSKAQIGTIFYAMHVHTMA
jgi:hypothetical protein